jgi:membrane fusion protein, multidrug efflux system
MATRAAATLINALTAFVPFPMFPSRNVFFPAAALLIAATLLSSCGRSDGTATQAPLKVTTMTIAAQRIPVVFEAVGRTEGSKEVEIRARVSGIVEKRLYNEGAFVRAGVALFQIERAPFEIALAQARASADQEAANSEQAKREVERLEGLIAGGAVSRRQAEEAATAYKASQAALAAAQARVRQAELNLSYTSVTAPIAGVTGRAVRSEGSLVTANDDSSLMTTISQTDPIWVRFALSETENDRLRQLQTQTRATELSDVVLQLTNDRTYAAHGRVNFSGSTVDRQLGTVQLRAEFANPQLEILPGQFATVRIVVGTEEAIVVPQTAVLQGSQGRYVWIVSADGKATQRTVEAGAWSGQDWVIRRGLNPGDTVIVDNLMKLRPGVAVAAEPTAPRPATG